MRRQALLRFVAMEGEKQLLVILDLRALRRPKARRHGAVRIM